MEHRGAAVRRTGKRAEKKNRKLSIRKQGKSGRKEAKAEWKKEKRKPETVKAEAQKKRTKGSGRGRAEVVICRGETAEGKKRLQMKLLAFSCVS